jgi:hypothetical protein
MFASSHRLYCGAGVGGGGDGAKHLTNLASHKMQKKRLLHCKKGFASFPSPAGKSLTKLSLARSNLIIPGQEEFGL